LEPGSTENAGSTKPEALGLSFSSASRRKIAIGLANDDAEIAGRFSWSINHNFVALPAILPEPFSDHHGRGKESQRAMRFPVYESLYFLNRNVEDILVILEEIKKSPGMPKNSFEAYQVEIQYLRSHATQDVLEVMNDTEIHEMAKLGKQKKAYDDSIRDLDDVYFEVQRREEQRRKQGLPPLTGVLPRKYEGHFSTPEERWEPDDEVADPTPSRAVHSKGRTSSRAQILSRNKSTNRPQRKSQSKRAS